MCSPSIFGPTENVYYTIRQSSQKYLSTDVFFLWTVFCVISLGCSLSLATTNIQLMAGKTHLRSDPLCVRGKVRLTSYTHSKCSQQNIKLQINKLMNFNVQFNRYITYFCEKWWTKQIKITPLTVVYSYNAQSSETDKVYAKMILQAHVLGILSWC